MKFYKAIPARTAGPATGKKTQGNAGRQWCQTEYWEYDDMTKMTFNTGRGYTSKGQIIHVYMDDGSTVRFYDISRDISGTLHTPFAGDDDLETFVMDEYDAGRYDNDSTARKHTT